VPAAAWLCLSGLKPSVMRCGLTIPFSGSSHKGGLCSLLCLFDYMQFLFVVFVALFLCNRKEGIYEKPKHLTGARFILEKRKFTLLHFHFMYFALWVAKLEGRVAK
jgi:hypothetical protein